MDIVVRQEATIDLNTGRYCEHGRKLTKCSINQVFIAKIDQFLFTSVLQCPKTTEAKTQASTLLSFKWCYCKTVIQTSLA